MIKMFCMSVEDLTNEHKEQIKQVDYNFYSDLEEDGSFNYEKEEEWILLMVDGIVRGYVCLFPRYCEDKKYAEIRLLNIGEDFRKFSSIFLRYVMKICQSKNQYWQCYAKQDSSLKLLRYLQTTGVINLVEDENPWERMYVPTYFTFN